MRKYDGQILEIGLLPDGQLTAWIECPPEAVPAAGRYLMAWACNDLEAPLATPLFAGSLSTSGFLAAPPIPQAWTPGEPLFLYGPSGRGFQIPAAARRLAVAALGNTALRLLPLLPPALEQGAAIALFCDAPITGLPSEVEIHPLSSFKEALDWTDHLALDLPLETLDELPSLLGREHPSQELSFSGQALVGAAMPCGGLADCGACALETRRGWRLACKDGPVFDLKDLIR